MNSDELFELSSLLYRFRNEHSEHNVPGIDLILDGLDKEIERVKNEELKKKGVTRRSPF